MCLCVRYDNFLHCKFIVIADVDGGNCTRSVMLTCVRSFLLH